LDGEADGTLDDGGEALAELDAGDVVVGEQATAIKATRAAAAGPRWRA
jgi:hypothetical protein